MGCAFHIAIVHPDEKISEIQNSSKINPINSVLVEESIPNQDENSVDTFVIDSPDFEYKKEIE